MFNIPSTLKLMFIVGLMGAIGYLYSTVPAAPVPVANDDTGSIIRLVDPITGRTYCSGTVLNDRFILTAAHCVLTQTFLGVMLNPDTIEIRQSDNKAIGVTGNAINANVGMDHAIIYGNFRKLPKRKYTSDFRTLDDIRLAPGQVLKACGYPLGGNLECSNIVVEDTYIFMWQTTGGWLIPGMSGGPVVLKDGTVVAVNVAANEKRRIVSPILNIEGMMKVPRKPSDVPPSPEEEN